MITLKQNDTGIGIEAILYNGSGPIDLTGANVVFLFDQYEMIAGIEDAANGKVIVVFEAVHTSVSGVYSCEFEIRYNDGRIETVPNDGYEKINIISDLGGR